MMICTDCDSLLADCICHYFSSSSPNHPSKLTLPDKTKWPNTYRTLLTMFPELLGE